MSKVVEHRAALHRVDARIIDVENAISCAAATSDRQFNEIKGTISQASETSSRRLESVSTKLDNAHDSVMSLRSTGERILSCLASFPREFRDLLQQILQRKWQMYQILLSIQRSMARSPTGLLGSNIKFEDALGEYTELPYELFRHWEVCTPTLAIWIRSNSCHPSHLRVSFELISRTQLERQRFVQANIISST